MRFNAHLHRLFVGGGHLNTRFWAWFEHSIKTCYLQLAWLLKSAKVVNQKIWLLSPSHLFPHQTIWAFLTPSSFFTCQSPSLPHLPWQISASSKRAFPLMGLDRVWLLFLKTSAARHAYSNLPLHATPQLFISPHLLTIISLFFLLLHKFAAPLTLQEPPSVVCGDLPDSH